MVNAFINYSLQLIWEGGWLSHEERPRDLACVVGGKLAQEGHGRALHQPASPAWGSPGQAPKVVMSVGTEEGSVSQRVPWVPQPMSRVTAMLPPSLGALLPMPPHRKPCPCSWQRSCGAMGLWAVSPSPTGPLSLWRASEEATAPGLLAKIPWLPFYARVMCPATSPFPCSSPQCSSPSTHSQGTTPNTPISAPTLPSQCDATVS